MVNVNIVVEILKDKINSLKIATEREREKDDYYKVSELRGKIDGLKEAISIIESMEGVH